MRHPLGPHSPTPLPVCTHCHPSVETGARRGRDRDRDRDRGRDRDRDRSRDRRRKVSRVDDEGGSSPAWKPGAPLPDQEQAFGSAPPSSYGHGRGGGGGGGRGGGGGGGGGGVCFDWQRGNCTRGDSCRFSHDGPPGEGGGGGRGGGGGGGGGRRGDGPPPEVFSVHHGEVRSIQSYGVFVNIPGFKDGLVHVSQMCSYRVEDPNDVVSVGQRVWVKVTEVDANSKVSLSMKMVDQESGRDEDPDNFEALESQGRKGGGGGSRGPMQFSEEATIGSVSMGLEQQMDGA